MSYYNTQYDELNVPAGSVWYSGGVPPLASLGTDGDYYLGTDGSVWTKQGGVWTSTGTSLKGPTGATGAQGPQGATGPQGVQGPAGPQGPAGTGINLKGAVNTAANLPAQPQPANDAYSVLDTGHLWVSTGTVWNDLGPFVGPQGPQGLTGPAGPAGPMGAQGPAGANGTVGPQGATGPVGPVGPEGPRGPQGAPGDPYGTPILAIGSIVHWRPNDMTAEHYALCKPAVVLGVWDEYHNLLSLQVLGYGQGTVPLFDRVMTGNEPGHWHYIPDCPFSFMMNPSVAYVPTAAGAAARTNGHVTFPMLQTLVSGGVT